MSISVAKWTVLGSICASWMTSFFALYLGHLPSQQLFELLPFFVCVLLPLHPELSSLDALE